MPQFSICRLCDSSCEVNVADFPNSLHTKSNDIVSGGFKCSALEQSLQHIKADGRTLFPKDRSGQDHSWDSASGEIQTKLKAIIAEHGRESLGLYLGPQVFRSSGDWIKSMAFGVSQGTTSIFSEMCMTDGARLLAIESMLGYATPLLSDIGRAHYVVFLGDDPEKRGWGTLQGGMSFSAQLAHSQKTKGTKSIVASPYPNSLSKTADQQILIRPGSECYFLLGLLSTMVKSNWVDSQYIRDYTENYAELKSLIAPWSNERCAQLCGIEPAELSGVALKFSRSAMSVIHPNPGTFSGPNALLAAWAWMSIHMVSANALRPGGLFENQGSIDLQPIFAQLHSSSAPKTRLGQHPLMLMQAPGTSLEKEINTEGDGQLKALFVIGEPLRRLPQPSALRAAYPKLELLVHITTHPSETSSSADWVLPMAHSWEHGEIDIHRNTLLPIYGLGISSALQAPCGESLPLSEILDLIFKGHSFSWKGSSWGRHVQFAAHSVMRVNVNKWIERISDFILDETPQSGINVVGEIDRSTWRPTNEKLDFVPQSIKMAIQTATEYERAEKFEFLLCTDFGKDRLASPYPLAQDLTQLTVHPSCGLKEGLTVNLITTHGQIEGVLKHNDTIHPEAIICCAQKYPTILNALNPATDSLCGAVVLNGEPCRLETLTE